MDCTMMDRSITLQTTAHYIQSVTHHLVFVHTIRRLLQQSKMSAKHPLLRLPLTVNHKRFATNGVINGGHGQRNGTTLCLTTNPILPATSRWQVLSWETPL
ncbi:hypothetical protein TNCV_493641 [Trichonephila clavipes]|nr:hypothetical protein TNCV_493641 [Trichonephila clavipes]